MFGMLNYTAFAADDPISVFLDGQALTFDVSPQIINGSTMVPLRAIFEALGATVDWNPDTQTVTATRGDTVVVLTVGDASPTVNGQVRAINQPGAIIGGRTLAPLRFVGEAFGGEVEWLEATRTVRITGGDGTSPSQTPADGGAKEKGLGDIIADLPNTAAMTALWERLDGFWNSPDNGGCMQFGYYEGKAYFCNIYWDSEPGPSGLPIGAAPAGEYKVNITVHYDEIEDDGYFVYTPAWDCVYQIDLSGIVAQKDYIVMRDITNDFNLGRFDFAGTDFDGAYAHYAKRYAGSR